MQRKNRGEGTSLPMGELVKDPAALARLAQSGEARQLVSMLKQSGGVQEAAQAAADEHPGGRRAGGAHQPAGKRVRTVLT